MSEEKSTSGAASAIVAVVAIIAILVMIYFLFFTGGGDGDTDINVKVDGLEEVAPNSGGGN